MATAFPDVKPFPQVRAPTIGDNSVPMEVEVVDSFVEALRTEGLLKRLNDLTERGNAVTDCATPDAAGRIGDFVKMASAATKAVEEEREKRNRPLLTAQRALKGKADTLVEPLNGAVAHVRSMLNKFLAEQERVRREEEARIARERREAEDAARAEQARRQAEENERAAAEQREAAPIVVEPEPVFETHVVPERAPLRGDYGSTVSTKETWDVRVTNIRQVPDAYLKHPTVIEALEKVIRPMVRNKNGLREIKGCEVFSTFNSAVR